MKLDKVLYTAHATATGGRDGRAKSSDGRIDVVLKPPKEMGGTGEGVNPEQLFAAGYAACFIGAIKFVGGQQKIAVPADTSIESSVGIGPIPQGFGVQVELKITIPGVDRAVAQSLIENAHKVCPYSNATRGNIEVTLTLA
jgi:osmotically inducible protein OsmC